ncbi:MAG: hypothetical protein M1817_001809 [Caeruleum heppii]|nr:MAG: hypothetical protein M1817_001809 [Caeruleum heppii]
MIKPKTFVGLLRPLLLISSISHVIAQEPKEGATVWDYAPDFPKDKFPPYPSVLNPDGSKIDVKNLRGTKLFGWKGCEPDDQKAIASAFDDFHKLVSLSEVSSSIDWNDQAAKDFFGAASGRNQIPDDRRKQIQQIFEASRQMYQLYWDWEPPWLSWKFLWIEVRCSGGDNSGDPDDICGDKKPDNPECPPPGGPPQGGTVQLEAYSDPAEKYSRITFCNKFFNELKSLGEAMDYGKKQPRDVQNNLETWNSRARCFLHEATHLDYFMDAPAKNPYISDLSFSYRDRNGVQKVEGYGPYNCKVLRNYIKAGKAGYYTQRNAETFAYFATAKYVQKEIGRYPDLPNPGSTKPTGPPKDAKGNPVAAEDTDENEAGLDEDLIGTEQLDNPNKDFSVPGCPDKFGGDIVIDDSPPPEDTPEHGSAGSVYGKFCDAVGGDQKKELKWTVDASGNEKSPSRRRRKRTPPPDPDAYGSYSFELDWAPKESSAGCNRDCKDAYGVIANSPCGHQGGQQNGMTASGSVDVGCGTYSYKITGEKVPEPEGPPKPFLSARYCFPSDVFGEHGDIQEEWQSQYTGLACAGSALATIKKDDPSTFINWHTTTNDVPDNYTISWKPNCESSVTEMNVYKPLEDNDADCLSMMQGNYRECSNGGIGGSISAGCVVYEFKASLEGSP